MQKLCDFEEKYRPFLVLFIVAFIAHLLFPLSWGDDAIFAARVDKMGFGQFINGSARPLTDSLTYVFSRWPFMWRLLNPTILTVFALVLSCLLSCENKKLQNFIICKSYRTISLFELIYYLHYQPHKLTRSLFHVSRTNCGIEPYQRAKSRLL